MSEQIAALLHQVMGLPVPLLYLVLGVAAALENVVPPIPADTVVLFGGFLAGRGVAHPALMFLVVWLCNVAGALGVYGIGRRYGPRFFAGRWGKLLLKPRQLGSLSAFYRRYGTLVIFVSRFLPMFRAVGPVFAGVSGLGFWITALPIALASALWYGGLVYLGALAGENWERILGTVNESSRWLGLVALIAVAFLVRWWWRTRREAPIS